jgi:hypothetical protein
MNKKIIEILTNAKEQLEYYIPKIISTNKLTEHEDINVINEQYRQALKEITMILDVYKCSTPISALDKLINQTKDNFDIIINNCEEIISNNNIEIRDYDDYYYQYKAIFSNLESYLEKLISIRYLCRIGNQNTIIVGKNGSGKSSFASFIKNSFSDNIVVIPAQKYLVCKSLHDLKSLSMNRGTLGEVQYRNYIGDLRESRYVDEVLNNLESIFSKLIITFCNEEVKKGLNYYYKKSTVGAENSLLIQLNNILSNIIPGVQVQINSDCRCIDIIKDDNIYNVNAMSDGEKVSLYYILHVILASEDSYIIVDEPETFLNTSVANRLWNSLEEIRQDCKFIYLSHNIDFIMSRKLAKLIWCVEYTYPNSWVLEDVEFQDNLLPNALIVSLLGTQKTILFCEGIIDEVSDYSFYSALFSDKVFVYPVGGHREVIQYVRKFNSSLLNGYYNAVGIIDHDFLSEETIDDYLKHKIFTLPFNEIEMALLCDEILESIVSLYANEVTTKEKITNFKKEAFDMLKRDKDKVVSQNVKFYIEEQINTFKITDAKNIETITDEFYNYFNKLKEKDLFKFYDDKINSIIDRNDYYEFLKISSLKSQLSKGLANKLLESNYLAKAIQRVAKDVDLRKLLIERYFKEFNELISEN